MEKFREHLFRFQRFESGKLTIGTLFFGVGLILLGLLVDLPHASIVNRAVAANATTSVTVLNTPPDWQPYGASASSTAQEEPGSSTTSPTNVGSSITWRALGLDSSGDNYYLLICKNASSTATGNASAPPTCPGGNTNQWAVSGATVSGVVATAATTTYSSDAESNTWYAFLCDGNASNPSCNPIPTQGSTGTTTSPFAVNHRPTFTAFIDTSPADPGVLVTWYSTSSDADVSGVADTVSLYVCRAADFTGSACGVGGTWCSAVGSSTDPSCNYVMESPKPDGNYLAVGYVVDNHGFAASGGQQASDSVLTINNIGPTTSAASVSLLDTDSVGPLTLLTANGQTTGFQVAYTVNDMNSCTTTVNTAEITSAAFNAYRSGVGSTSCDTAGEYNANNCYPSAAGTGIINYTCSQNPGTCSGNTDFTSVWTCYFPMWYIAEATDGTGTATDSPYFAQNWLVSVQVADDDFATSSLTEASSGNEMQSFLAYDVTTSTIPYGGLQPGQQNDPLAIFTVIRALGNVGLDEILYGTDMCTTYPTCTGNATSTIFTNNQRYATSGVAYAAATALLTNPGAEIEINVQKTTATASPATRSTFWAIAVPGAITVAGDYFGQNTLIGVTGESANW